MTHSAIDTVCTSVLCTSRPQSYKWRRKEGRPGSQWSVSLPTHNYELPGLLTANEVMSIKLREPEKERTDWPLTQWNESKHTGEQSLAGAAKQAPKDTSTLWKASASRVQRKIYRIYFNFNSCCRQRANRKWDHLPISTQTFSIGSFRRHNICHACWRLFNCNAKVMYIQSHELLLKYRHRRRLRHRHSQSWKCQFSSVNCCIRSWPLAASAGKVISRNITPLEKGVRLSWQTVSLVSQSADNDLQSPDPSILPSFFLSCCFINVWCKLN